MDEGEWVSDEKSASSGETRLQILEETIIYRVTIGV